MSSCGLGGPWAESTSTSKILRVDCERRYPSQQAGRGGAEGVTNAKGVVQGKDRDASAPGCRSDGEAEGGGRVSATAELKAIETSINECSGLHGYQKVDTKFATCPACKKDTRLCNANPLPRGPQRPSCGGGGGGPGGFGGSVASMPLMGRGDDTNSGTRDGRGGCAR